MILHGAIGDAYGVSFEFADSTFVKVYNHATVYVQNPNAPSYFKRYTDDTQMAIGLAELIIEESDWTPLNIASKFLEVFKRDVRGGYAGSFYHFLTIVESGEEFLEKIIPTSERNGAAMRAYPLGIFKTENEVLEKAKIQAEVTHQTEKAVRAAEAIALISHFFFYKKGTKNELIDYLAEVQKVKWKTGWSGLVGCNAQQTVEAVLTVLTEGRDLQKMLHRSVDFEGDTDTVASLVLALGSLSNEFENNLPACFYEELENGTYGRDYIEELDKKLLKHAAKI